MVTTARVEHPGGSRPVLSARFDVPPVPAVFVRRERLLTLLTDAAESPLTLVSGPAGAGKTLCVADWVRHRAPWPAVWLGVEPDLASPEAFWAYVREALRRHGVPLPRVDDVGHSPPDRLAAYLHGRPEPVLLVLDGIDPLSSPEICDDLEFLLRHSGRGLRLVLTGRAEPPLPLHRRRAADDIAEIRAPDLAFDVRETAELLVRHGLDPADATALTDRTQGWAAGVRLCALAMTRADAPGRFLAGFDAGHSTVADYLLGEVLDGLPAESRDLLLRVSVLPQVQPPLADALTGREDAEGILADLERANAFVTAAGHSRYRIHPLFAEVLRARLRSRHPGLERGLRRTAARRLHEAGRLDDALAQAAAAGDWRFAADRLVDDLALGRLFLDADGPEGQHTDTAHGPEGQHTSTAHGPGPESHQAADTSRPGPLAWLAAMPPGVSGAAPELVRAACALGRYDVVTGVVHLRRAENRLRSRSRDHVNALLGLALLRVIASRLLGSADTAEAAALEAERLGRLVPAGQLAGHPELPALLLANLGAAELWAGRLTPARKTLSGVVDLPDLPVTAGPRHDALGRIALIDFLRGWYREADAAARAAVPSAERDGPTVARGGGVAHLVLAGLAVERNALDTARTELRLAALSAGDAGTAGATGAAGTAEATGTAGTAGDAGTAGAIEATGTAKATGATRAAETTEATRTPRTTGAAQDPVLAAGLAILTSRLLLAEGDPRASLRALSAADDRSRAGVRSPWVAARIALAEAAADLARGDPGAALQVLDAAADDPECAVVAARARLAQDDPRAALGILDSRPVGPEWGPALVVRTLLARAEAADRLGDARGAEHLAVHALDLARPERLRRPFLEAGPWLARALHGRHRHRTPSDGDLPEGRGAAGARPPPGPADTGTSTAPSPPGAARDLTVVEPLSRRECDVLRHVAQLKSTEEVADDLFLSVNTVKSHLKSIFRKLGANRRGEAVRRAQEQGLL